jgi:hypothetical protein
MASKTPCPITQETFVANAKPILLQVDGQTAVANVKSDFKPGSFGWNINGSITVMVDGIPCKAQMSGNIVICNSAEAPRTNPVARVA